MKKDLLAIAITFQEEFNKELFNVWQTLKKNFNIKYISSRSPIPHLTLASGHIKDISKIDQTLKRKKFLSFNLCSLGLGILANKHPLIYIRWGQSNKLISLYNKINKSTAKFFIGSSLNSNFSSWIPKTTIAYKDFKYEKLNLILKKINNLNIRSKIKANKIVVLRIDKSGEKIIYSYKLI